MSCQYKNECPSYTGWCEGPKQDFSKCVPFLITAYENEKKCSIKEKEVVLNILHKWEFFFGQRAGRELWVDKPREVQNKDIIDFNRDIEKVKLYILNGGKEKCYF